MQTTESAAESNNCITKCLENTTLCQLQLKSYKNDIHCGIWKHFDMPEMMKGTAYKGFPICWVSRSPSLGWPSRRGSLASSSSSHFPLHLQFPLFHPGCHCLSGLKQMPQESPTSLDKQLSFLPHPPEESQLLASTGARTAMPCSLQSSQAARDGPQACLGH